MKSWSDIVIEYGFVPQHAGINIRHMAEEIVRLRDEFVRMENSWRERCGSWPGIKNELARSESKRAKLRDGVSRHVQYIRHAEKRYLEVGKEKYDWAKLNGPLSAIERELAADAAEDL